MLKKITTILLLILMQFTACACADDNAASVYQPFTDDNQPAFACVGDENAPELALTYPNGQTFRLSMAGKLLLKGQYPPENEYVTHNCSAAAYEDILAVFIPASLYFAERPDSVLQISQDGVAAWQELTVPTADYVISKSALGFTAPNQIWLLLEGGIGGEDLRFYKSADGGSTWTQKVIAGSVGDMPIEARRLDYINFLSADEGYLATGAGFYGAAPLVYKTVDGGETWAECNVQTEIKDDYFHINDIRYVDDVLVMSGHLVHGDYVVLTSDDGLTWRQQ